MHEQRLRNESGGQIFQTRRSQQVSDLILDHALNGQDEQALGRMEGVMVEDMIRGLDPDLRKKMKVETKRMLS